MTKRKSSEFFYIRFFSNFFRMLSENIFSLNFCPPNICDPNCCSPNIYDKSTPMITSLAIDAQFDNLCSAVHLESHVTHYSYFGQCFLDVVVYHVDTSSLLSLDQTHLSDVQRHLRVREIALQHPDVLLLVQTQADFGYNQRHCHHYHNNYHHYHRHQNRHHHHHHHQQHHYRKHPFNHHHNHHRICRRQSCTLIISIVIIVFIIATITIVAVIISIITFIILLTRNTEESFLFQVGRETPLPVEIWQFRAICSEPLLGHIALSRAIDQRTILHEKVPLKS